MQKKICSPKNIIKNRNFLRVKTRSVVYTNYTNFSHLGTDDIERSISL